MLENLINLINKNFKKDLKKSIALSGKCFLQYRKKYYNSYKNLIEADFKIFSQNGEDGIIDFLLEKLAISNTKFVEIGVEDYEESNTRFIYETRNSSGLIIDASINLKKFEKNLDLWKGNLLALKENVNSDNINKILEKNNFTNNIDLFSIDIDGIDYWVIEKLPEKISKIFVAEYNPLFGADLEITVPNIKNFNRTNYHYSNLCFGMSLKALINIMKKKGYVFLGVNNLKNNAFFIIENLATYFDKIINSLDLNNLKYYTDSKFMESRDKNSKLQYLSKNQEFDLLKETEVQDLSFPTRPLKKIKDLL